MNCKRASNLPFQHWPRSHLFRLRQSTRGDAFIRPRNIGSRTYPDPTRGSLCPIPGGQKKSCLGSRIQIIVSQTAYFCILLGDSGIGPKGRHSRAVGSGAR